MAATTTTRRVLVYGGRGALGNECVEVFKQHGFTVNSVDLLANDAAHANVLVQNADKWEDQAEAILSGVKQQSEGQKFDAILCMAGGWQGGSADSDSFIRSCDAMWRQSVWSSVIAARLASQHLADGGTLVFMGANAAFDPTPYMIGYGAAKAAVHHLVRSLAADKSGLPPHAFVAALCPITLDTPANRAAMPKADTSSWTPLSTIANRIHDWVEGRQRPASGSLVSVRTQGGQTVFSVDH